MEGKYPGVKEFIAGEAKSARVDSDPPPLIEYHDLRTWIERARELGEIREVTGLSWQSEIGMAAEVVLHDENAPCIIFEDIPDSLPGSRVLTNFFGGRRRNMTLGFPLELGKLQLSEAFRTNYLSQLKTIPPRYVESGPVMENVLTGDDVDVLKFPAPKWHEGDGGRYIGTGTFNITRDPEEGWINCGTYRVMVHDSKSVGFYISPGKHGRIHRDKYQARNEPMPVAIVVGGDPLSFLISCTELPYGVSEYDIIGGIRGEGVEVIEGPITGLPIPAHAEIVLEGFVYPGSEKVEGPFGEWQGYYASTPRPEPVLDVKAIYHRNDPIILGVPPQRPPDEVTRFRSVTRSAVLKQEIQAAGVPDVTAAWAHEVGGSRLLLAVSITQRYAGHATQAGHIASQCHAGAYSGRYVVVTDEDIDVTDLDEVVWAMLTRSDPANSIDIIRNAWSTPADAMITPDQRQRGDFTNSRAIINACRPFWWKDDFPKVNAPSLEDRRIARERFGFLLR